VQCRSGSSHLPFDAGEIGWLTALELDEILEITAGQIPHERWHGCLKRNGDALEWFPRNVFRPLMTLKAASPRDDRARGRRVALPFQGDGACTVVVPNLEKKSKSGKYLSKTGRGKRGFRVLQLWTRGLAW
jgi:hypothetical protein